jgi:hypothetical protein
MRMQLQGGCSQSDTYKGRGNRAQAGHNNLKLILLHSISILHNNKCFKFNTKTVTELETINTPLQALILGRLNIANLPICT